MEGKLIFIEGACDGIGKTTQYQMLSKRLKDDGNEVVMHHFPSYNTKEGALVEMYLKGEFGHPSTLSPYFVNSLYAIDRAVTWNKSLKENFNNGKTILLDRYTTSSIIYQSALIEDEDEKKKFIDFVTDYEYNKLGIKKPDSVIFLYAPFDVVTKLRAGRVDNEGVINDIHERDLSFMKKVYDNAMFVAKYLNWDMIKCDRDNSFKSIEEIHNDVYNVISNKK